MSRNVKLTAFLIWIVLAFAIILILGSQNWLDYYNLMRNGVLTEGSIIIKEPESHRRIYYSYFVDEKPYNGLGHGGYGNPSFEKLQIGEKVRVFYLSSNPKKSCLGNPKELLENETIFIVLAALFVPSIIVFRYKQLIKKKLSGKQTEQPSSP